MFDPPTPTPPAFFALLLFVLLLFFPPLVGFQVFYSEFLFLIASFSSIEVMKMLHIKILASREFSNYTKLKPGKSGT